MGRVCVVAGASLAALVAGQALAAEPSRQQHVLITQVPPSAADLQRYTGLHAAAARGDAAEIRRLLAQGMNPDARDGHGRTAPRRRLPGAV